MTREITTQQQEAIVKALLDQMEEAGAEDSDHARGQCYAIANAADILALAGVITAQQQLDIKGY